mmetsp:Transcript_57748/g.80155  ORF Transcript_57748/g.80155 Transcript_57748/m.80155 type:complete len:192 (-) Transcript_57748:59-634(-)
MAQQRTAALVALCLCLCLCVDARTWFIEITAIEAYPDLVIREGDAVAWRNGDGVAHTTTSLDGFWDQTLQPGEEFLLPFGSEGDFAYHDALYPEVEAGSVRVLARDYGVPSVGLSPIPEAPPLDGLNFTPIDGYGSLSGNGVGLFGFSSDYDPKTTRGFLSPGEIEEIYGSTGARLLAAPLVAAAAALLVL